MIAVAGCEDGLYLVAVGGTADEDVLAAHEPGAAIERSRPLELVPSWAATHVLDVDSAGSTIVLLLDRRPPLVFSYDAGVTWSERGSGLPAGHAVALGRNPDDVLYGARNRLYVSRNGGLFWRAVGVELPQVHDVAWS